MSDPATTTGVPVDADIEIVEQATCIIDSLDRDYTNRDGTWTDRDAAIRFVAETIRQLQQDAGRTRDALIASREALYVYVTELRQERDALKTALDTREQRANPPCQHVWRAHCEPGSYQAFAVCSICGVRGG